MYTNIYKKYGNIMCISKMAEGDQSGKISTDEQKVQISKSNT